MDEIFTNKDSSVDIRQFTQPMEYWGELFTEALDKIYQANT